MSCWIWIARTGWRCHKFYERWVLFKNLVDNFQFLCFFYKFWGIDIFGAKVSIEQTRTDFDSGRDFQLRDGSMNFADFSTNRNNRFLTSETRFIKYSFTKFQNRDLYRVNFDNKLNLRTQAASKNRLSKPVKNLHFYNAPASISIKELEHISHSFHILPPNKLRTFKKSQDKGKLLRSTLRITKRIK